MAQHRDGRAVDDVFGRLEFPAERRSNTKHTEVAGAYALLACNHRRLAEHEVRVAGTGDEHSRVERGRPVSHRLPRETVLPRAVALVAW